MIIIGLCGFQGSGKDTIADILVNKHSFIKLSFASSTKDILSILFGWNRDMLEGITTESRKKREEVDEWWSKRLDIENFTPRMAMQKIGTDLFRTHFLDDIWTAIIEKKILNNLNNLNKNIVISDCRFPNEINMIKKYGGKLIHIERNLPIWFHQYKNGIDLEEASKLHKSETAWIRSEFDLIITNEKSIEDLYLEIENILNNKF
jgi:dephospho-CoA kinase